MLPELLESIQTDWKHFLKQYPKWDELEYMYSQECNKESDFEVLPPRENIFACFNYFNIHETKVVIIGQDPYHKVGQATGLAFAVNTNTRTPPSLMNIFKLIDKTQTQSDLKSWAQQGVLLLNTSLSVRESQPGSHIHIWKEFTQWILTECFSKTPRVTIVWGAHAHSIALQSNIVGENTFISSHPSPLSAYKQYKTHPSFLDSNVFQNVNLCLTKLNQTPIKW